MASWSDVVALAGSHPGAAAGRAHDGSPAYDVGGAHFVRFRVWGGRAILQFWCRDLSDADYYRSRPDVYIRVDTFTRCTSVWAVLEHLDRGTVRELVAESWATRAPRRLRSSR